MNRLWDKKTQKDGDWRFAVRLWPPSHFVNIFEYKINMHPTSPRLFWKLSLVKSWLNLSSRKNTVNKLCLMSAFLCCKSRIIYIYIGPLMQSFGSGSVSKNQLNSWECLSSKNWNFSLIMFHFKTIWWKRSFKVLRKLSQVQGQKTHMKHLRNFYL